MFSGDSPPDDKTGSLHLVGEEVTTGDREKEPSSYDFSDFK